MTRRAMTIDEILRARVDEILDERIRARTEV